MDPIISKMNSEILEFIENMDADPNAERPTTFWFYSDSEENIYRLAHHLQELGLRIEYCGTSSSCGDAPDYLLIAEKWMRPTMETMNNLWTYFTDIATRFNVTYDGWETRIEP